VSRDAVSPLFLPLDGQNLREIKRRRERRRRHLSGLNQKSYARPEHYRLCPKRISFGNAFDTYRPELYYMRGPGPKWRAKHSSTASDTTATMPGRIQCGRSKAQARSASNHPVTLTYDNGAGLVFARTIAVDDHYLFTIKDAVINKSASAVTLFPYTLISRRGTPQLIACAGRLVSVRLTNF
jgi:YidC-like protein